MTHTPGPWVVGEVRSPAGVKWDCIVRTKDGAPVTTVLFAGYTFKEAKANARLIAAAPDILTALKECAGRLRYDGDHHHDLGLESRRDASWEAMRMAEAAIEKAEASEPSQ